MESTSRAHLLIAHGNCGKKMTNMITVFHRHCHEPWLTKCEVSEVSMRQVSRRPALDLVNSMAPVLLAYSALLFVSATTPMVDGIAMLLHAADPGHGGCWPPCAAEVGIGRCAQGAMGPPTEGRSRLRARAHGFLAEGGAQQVRTSAQRWRGSCVSNGNVCIWELPIFIETENRKAATRIVVECSPCKAS